jgi:uncharacterized protein (TIGR00297 family)
VNLPTPVLGFFLGLAFALAAWRAGALSLSGMVAATVAGTIAVAAGWSWAALLIAFFTSSTALGRVRARARAARLEGRVAKTGARDAAQVIANGGVFVIAALGWWISPQSMWQLVGAGGLAASAADTWATEIGTLARTPPRSILTGRAVEVGTSGGVTLAGSIGAIGGALFIAAAALLADWPVGAATAAMFGGIVGCGLDSALGASVQARRWCATCRMATEQPVHRCGTLTAVVGGQRWLNNDGVNAIASAVGALAGAAMAVVL